MPGIVTNTLSGAPTSGVSGVQTLTISGAPATGTFKLAYRGQTTTSIPWSSTNATLVASVQTALQGLSTINSGNLAVANVSLSSGVGDMSLTFQGTLARTAVLPITVAEIALTGSAPDVDVAIATAGVDASFVGSLKGSLVADIVTGDLYRNVGTAAAPVWQKVHLAPRVVEAKTANYTILTSDDNGKVFTNLAASGAVTFSLPPATVGQGPYHFQVAAAFALNVDPSGSEVAALHTGVIQAPGKYVGSSTVGNFISLHCIEAGKWHCCGAVGTGWAAEP